MNPAFKEIKNWQLFVDKFGESYSMHDAVVTRFDLNEDELTVLQSYPPRRYSSYSNVQRRSRQLL